MKDILIVVGIFASWIALNVWFLPYFGIRTCMSGACRAPDVKPNKPCSPADKAIPDTKLTEGVEHR